MTVFEKWVVDTSEAIVKLTKDEYEELDPFGDPDWDKLRLRLAITIVQARAAECRQMGTAVSINAPGSIREIAAGHWDRSHKLEELGIRMANGEWPPKEETNEEV